MDSRLLNVFHDDPFDGNYVKYENDAADLWTSEATESLGLQLTETLHGILPMAPSDTDVDVYDSVMLKDEFQLEHRKEVVMSSFHNKNALIFAEDFGEEHISGNGIEIIHVDPNATDDSDDDSNDAYDDANADRLSQSSGGTFRSRTDSSSIGDYESHSSDYDNDDDDDDDVEAADVQHNDDDDDGFDLKAELESPEAVLNELDSVAELSSAILGQDDFILAGSKSRTFSTNTIGSDVDGLGMQIDASTFDLADFITKDDFTFNQPPIPVPVPLPTAASSSSLAKGLAPARSTPLPAPPKKAIPLSATVPQVQSAAAVVQATSSTHSGSDSDSDVIVDVETVEAEVEQEDYTWIALKNSKNAITNSASDHTREEEDVPFVDNVKKDPLWHPKQTKKADAPVKEGKPTQEAMKSASAGASSQHNFGRNFSMVPSKRQSDLLKGKLGGARGKNGTKARVGKSTAKKSPNGAETNGKEESVVRMRMGVGQGGKNLALIAKQLQQGTSELSSEENTTPQKVAPASVPSVAAQQDKEQEQDQLQQTQAIQKIKRKLNLEEYKQRRGGITIGAMPDAHSNHSSAKMPKMERDPRIDSKLNGQTGRGAASVSHLQNTTPTKHSEAVTAIVRSLKESSSAKGGATDPITEAKNKVLRMQELKKAQQLRILDSTVSAKVPKVTKLLPLKDIVKDTYYCAAEDDSKKSSDGSLKTHPDYEEIIIVSASCNTDISIPPIGAPAAVIRNGNVSRSLLKSSTLLYNISNSLQKSQVAENVKISTNSLISSIQDVVVKTTLPIMEQQVAAVSTGESIAGKKDASAQQHGEDKIIMHLRKDRIRKRTSTMSTQTDLHPNFPLLPLPKVGDSKSRERERRKTHRRTYRKRRVTTLSGSSDESDADSDSCSSASAHSIGRRSYRSRSRSVAGESNASSTDRLRQGQGQDAVANGGYSSRSSRRHRSSISSSYSESERITSRQRQRQRHSKSSYKQRTKRYSRSSSTSSLSDYSDRSRSRTRSRSRSRSRGSYYRRSCSPSSNSRSSNRKNIYKNNANNTSSTNNNTNNSVNNNNNTYVDRKPPQPAVEERRIVYVGRIEQETTKEMLRRKFIAYGTIKQITIHYKETGMKYGFVTYERSQDAFTAIDSSMRDPQINMYDISFGGRRAFCRASYADLDNAGINTYHSFVFPQAAPPPKQEDSFEALLLKVKAKMNASKAPAANAPEGATKM